MDLYTLSSGFQREKLIDTFVSVVWTERYDDFGDIQLVTPATPEMINAIPTGTFISTPESQEVMWIETAEIENDLLTVKGPSLMKVLTNFVIRTTADPEQKYWIITGESPGDTVTAVVQNMCIGGPYLDGSTDVGLDLAKQIIPGLTIGESDNSYDPIDSQIPFGSLYDAIKAIAQAYSLGINLQLVYVDSIGPRFEFNCYRGRNLTSEMLGFGPTVTFTPTQDSLKDVKELRSSSGYKNICHVFAPTAATALSLSGSTDVGEVGLEAFDRRAIMLFADDITAEQVGNDLPTLVALLTQRGRDYLANNNYTKIIDGEVVPQSQYKFGIDYNLGDIVDLVSTNGQTQQARITEYIRTQDQTGSSAYPTVTVLDESEIGPT